MDVHPTKNVSIGIDPYPNHGLFFCKWKNLGFWVRGELAREPVVTMDALSARESGQGAGSDRLHELKIKMAVEAYESRPLEIS